MVRIVAAGRIVNLTAIYICYHIVVHVSLITVDYQWGLMSVSVRITAPSVRRGPTLVIMAGKMGKDEWPGTENRTDHIVVAINVRIPDDLYSPAGPGRVFHNYRSYILVSVIAKHGLNKKNVDSMLSGFNDSQIIDISIPVQVQI